MSQIRKMGRPLKLWVPFGFTLDQGTHKHPHSKSNTKNTKAIVVVPMQIVYSHISAPWHENPSDVPKDPRCVHCQQPMESIYSAAEWQGFKAKRRVINVM